MKSKEELFNMPEDDIERDPLELLTASKLFDYMKYANGSVNIEF